MAIEAWENNTEVVQPDGHRGRLRVTRRERKLIDDGRQHMVAVLGADGILRTFEIESLTLEPTPEQQQTESNPMPTMYGLNLERVICTDGTTYEVGAESVVEIYDEGNRVNVYHEDGLHIECFSIDRKYRRPLTGE